MTLPKAASPTVSSNPHPHLVLASESPRRLALLAQAGIVPDAVKPSAIDEAMHRGEEPRTHVQRLAREKAAAVACGTPGSLVLAADTIVVCGRRVLPKAADGDEV